MALRSFVLLSMLAAAWSQGLEQDCSQSSNGSSLSLLQGAAGARRAARQHESSAVKGADVDDKVQLEAQPSTSWQLLLSKYNLSERIDGPAKNTTPTNASLVVIVTHRELVIGCHDFERFLSPDYETWFVFEKTFARAWGLDDKVKSGELPGRAQLLLTDVVTGEVHARSAVISILKLEAAERSETLASLPEFMYSTMCDIQPLPTWHPYHVPFPDMVFEMVRALAELKALRKAGQATQVQDVVKYRDGKFVRVNETCFNMPPEDRLNLPIMTMNNVILESLPQGESVRGAKLHGLDVGKFVQQGGLRSAKPWLGRNASEAIWYSDVTTFVEDHSILYDLALYLEHDEGSIFELLQKTGDMLFHNEVYLGELMCRQNSIGVRHNGLFTFYDRAHPEQRSGSRTIMDASSYAGVDLEFLRRYNLEVLAGRDSPIARLTQFMSAAANMQSTNDIEWGNSFAVKNFNRWWLPMQLQAPPQGTAGSVRALQLLLGPLFELIGFEPVSEAAAWEYTRLLSPAGTKEGVATDSNELCLRRTTAPMSRMLLSARLAQGFEPLLQTGSGRVPNPPMHVSCKTSSCELFLDLWLPNSAERLAVWTTDGPGGDITNGLVPDLAATLLRLPLDAELLYVGRPIGDNSSFAAMSPELKISARHFCEVHEGRTSVDVFLPAPDRRWNRSSAVAPMRPGNAQGIPPTEGWESCPLFVA